MPKSKKNREVALTKTKPKKGREFKSGLIDELRKSIEEYKYMYVLEVQNPRNNLLKDVREQWKDSRFFFSKNTVLKIALGQTEAEEVAPGLAKLSDKVKGQRGLLLTNRTKEETLKWFKEHVELEYARSGFKATRTVSLDAGPIAQFSHAIEPHLRHLGLPTSLVKGVVTLTKDHTVCEADAILTPEQCSILKLFEMPMATFEVELKYVWVRKTGKVKRLGKKGTDESHAESMDTA